LEEEGMNRTVTELAIIARLPEPHEVLVPVFEYGTNRAIYKLSIPQLTELMRKCGAIVAELPDGTLRIEPITEAK